MREQVTLDNTRATAKISGLLQKILAPVFALLHNGDLR